MIILDPQSRVISADELPTFNGKTIFNIHERLLHFPETVSRDEQRWYATAAYDLYGTQTVRGFLMPSPELVAMSPAELCKKANNLCDIESEEYNYLIFVIAAKCNMLINKLTHEQSLLDLYDNIDAQHDIFDVWAEVYTQQRKFIRATKNFDPGLTNPNVD